MPEDKIRARFGRNGALIRTAALMVDRAHIYDNSKLGEPPRRILSFTNGKIDFIGKPLLRWVRIIYLKDLKAIARKR